jgi:hypothetical protein
MTDDLEKRISDLEHWRNQVEPHINCSIPLGPNPDYEKKLDQQRDEEFKLIVDQAVRQLREKTAPLVDRSAQQLVSGDPVPDNHSHTKLKDNGQQLDYVVLSPEERAKGFVRPVRRSYRHVGPLGSQHSLRDLTDEEKDRYPDFGYVKFEPYPPSDSSVIGKFWTQKGLDAIGKGCGTLTTMGQSLAETYARDPKFYSGTFCCGCSKHLPVEEFVWDGTNERVGS